MIRKQTSKWTTKDGTKVRLCDMSDSHLHNAINIVEKAAELKRRDNLLFYLGCPEPTGDMAQLAFDREVDNAIDATMEDFLPEIHNKLILEKERRGEKMNKQFYIAGVQFHDMKKVLNDLKIGDELDLIREPDNKYDPNAVRIEFGGVMLGYVPKKFSAEVSGALEIGVELECVIDKVNPKAKPWEQCKVTVKKIEEDTEQVI
jgi:signal recognition particle subunit SEC65